MATTPMHPDRVVKYRVVPMQGALLMEIRLPLEAPSLTGEQVARLNEHFAIVTKALGAIRDQLAAEVAERGVCPFCGEVLHPEGQGC